MYDPFSAFQTGPGDAARDGEGGGTLETTAIGAEKVRGGAEETLPKGGPICALT